MKKITFILFLIASSINAQNIIFPINSATTSVSGPSVTETIVQDGKTYVLVATNTAGVDAQLFDFGGRIQFRTLPNSETEASWIITITEDGVPFNFTFGSVDYLTLGSGTYNITNDSGASIKNSINLFMGGSTGNLSPDNTSNAQDIDGFNINSTNSFTDGPLTDVAFYNIEINPTSLSTNQNIMKEVSFFPNPAEDKIYIKSQDLKDKKVIIYDLNGRILKNLKTKEVIDISNLSKGIYVMYLEIDNRFITKKITIK